MDGNFVDNDYNKIVESAAELFQGVAVKPRRSANEDKLTFGIPVPGAQEKYDKFKMRLRFSHGLDPKSVVPENTTITAGRRKVRTSVEYDENRRSIIISPKSKYLRNTLYVLKVSGKIMSEKGRSLRENRFYVFEQDGKTLNFYRDIKPGDTSAPNTLSTGAGSLLPAFFALSALVIVFSYFESSKLGLAIGTVLVLVATVAAFLDSISDIGKSHREYVYGAKLYNKGFFYEAVECFERAVHYYPGNERAKAGLDAAIIKCTESLE